MDEAIQNWLYVAVISALPWIELRGGIPVAILKFGFNPLLSLLVASIANCMVIYPSFIFLDWFFDLMNRMPLMNKLISSTHQKAKPYVDKYGMFGLGVFVAIPLPGTGAYAGALAAHLFGIKGWKALASIAAGVFTAGIIVTIVTLFFKESLGFFIKY